MREQLIKTFTSLPPEGIGVHGTTREIALQIKKVGFDPAYAHGSENFGAYTFYVIQPPTCTSTRAAIRSLTGRSSVNPYMDKAVNRSYIAAHNDTYALNANSEQSRQQALILFRPLDKFTREELNTFTTPFVKFDPRPIPPENILGVIDVPEGATKMTPEILKAGIKLLQEKGILEINLQGLRARGSGVLQLPQEE